jgi:hypothetical protein
MQGIEQDSLTRDYREAELHEYQAVSAGALFGLFLAVVSAAAFAHPVLWFLPVVAALANLLALARIASQAPRLLGRPVALFGLVLSLILGAAAPSYYAASGFRTRHEAQFVARQWLDDVRHHRLEAAAELMLEPFNRLPAGEDPVTNYRDEPRAMRALRELSERPLVVAIEAIGAESQVHYLDTIFHHITPFKERVSSLWALTYKDDGKLKSILVRASLERDKKGPTGRNFWWLTKVDLVTNPPDWLKP